MRFFRVLTSVICLLAAASAAEIKIKVVDPQSAVVAGAQVVLTPRDSTTPAAVAITSAEGLVVFREVASGPYQVQVLAKGFAAASSDASPSAEMVTVKLRLTAAAETVVVTATRTPVPTEAAGADVEALSGAQLETMQPIAGDDALRFLPGAVVDTQGQRGGLSSLFVRGGDSRYNKVIVDGVTVNEPGGRFDFGTLPLAQADRVEFVRGAQSALYGSDAMTSVVQVWTRTGTTTVPELRLGADGGNLGTAHGYLNFAGAHGPFDYNLFGDQFNTSGQGPNDDYSNSLQGGNLGIAINDRVSLRIRGRHSNSRTGVQGEWNFNGNPLMQPDLDQFARLNDLLGSVELSVSGPSRWQHRFTGFDYHQQRTNVDNVIDPGRISPSFGNIDFPFHSIADLNRAGFEYQGEYVERSWAQTTIGYRFEDENGFVGDLTSPPLDHGLRLNHEVYGQQQFTLGRLSVVAGARFVHNGSFGNKGVPRVALTLQALRGGQAFSGTRLRFSYATGIKEPLLEESFASGPFTIPNPNLKPETNRAFEAGIQQGLFGGRYALTATYFNNLFRDQIEFASSPTTFIGQYVNVNEAFAHGAEVELQGKIVSRLSLNTAYTYTSTQILQAPLCTAANFCDPLLATGQPFIRRPKHSATALLTYLGRRWGANLGGSFVGRRPDSDFFGFGITHAAGYVRVDMGGWYALTSRVTAYVNLQNALDKQYEEVVGYPALGVNFRAGMRFRIGGE
jgi:outer membrane cobalamin receptor